MFLVSHQIVCECCLILRLKGIKITPILLPKVLPETRQRTLKSLWTPGLLTTPTQTPPPAVTASPLRGLASHSTLRVAQGPA